MYWLKKLSHDKYLKHCHCGRDALDTAGLNVFIICHHMNLTHRATVIRRLPPSYKNIPRFRHVVILFS